MQIDWFTFAAQIVNFLILVWLLKRFLYGPIIAAMAEREERIADRFAEAQEKREAAEAEIAEYRQKQETLEKAREEKLAAAEHEAEEYRKKLIDEARTDVDRMEAQWKEALQREREAFLNDLARRVSHETLALAHQTIRDLAHADLEREVVRVFIDRLESLDEDQRQALMEAVQAEEGTVTVHTAFEVDDEVKKRLVDTLQAVTDTDVSPAFDQEAGVGVGIEVRAGGRKVAWSLNSYFSELEERIRNRIDAEIAKGKGAPKQPEMELDDSIHTDEA